MSLRLLHYSDLENVYDTPERAGRLAGRIRQLRDADTLVVGSGDNTAPGVLSLVTGGRQALDFFDAVRPDFDTFGNHEFDHGLDGALDLVAASPQTWVSANVRLDGEPFGADAGATPAAVAEANGSLVGVFGVLDEATPSINPSAAHLELTDAVAAARGAEDDLRDRGADYVVCLSHLGQGDERLAAETTVDAVLGGHISTERVDTVDGTLLARPGANGEVLLEVELDGDGAAVTRHETAGAPVHSEVTDALRARLAATGLDDVVATVDDPLERTETTVFGGESRIGNFVADAYRWACDADVALQNSGGIREGPALAGEVTVADLVSVLPFDEPVVLAELTGAELLAVLADADDASLGFAEPGWWHAHVSGVRLVYDHAAGELVEATVGGEPVDPEATYTLATSDYLFHTDDEFPALRGRHRVRRLDAQHEVLARYAREHGVDASVEGRVVRRGADE